MAQDAFRTPDGCGVAAVTADEMREVDRVAVEEVGLQLLQMMENAGRTLARHAREIQPAGAGVLVVAGDGGNGGGGMACARHLANRGLDVRVLLDRPPADLTDAAAHQHRILSEMGVPTATESGWLHDATGSTVVVDAMVGYGLTGEIRPPARGYVEAVNRHPGATLSLDVPSGVDATTGDTHGVAVAPDRTVTLALPKTGLDAVPGALFLADIAIPATVYERLGIEYDAPFGEDGWVELES